MQLYWRIGSFVSVHIEVATVLGKKPLLSLNKYHKEVIVDAPFTRVIISPMSSLQREKTFDAKDQCPPPKPGASG